MVVIDAREWSSSLNNNLLTGSVSEYSLRYRMKEGREVLDLTDYGINGHLKLQGFFSLWELDCSGNRQQNNITLSYNDFSRNDITNLDLSDCPELRKLDCSGNGDLVELNISNCRNLTNINIVGCRKLNRVICDNSPYSSDDLFEKAQMSHCNHYGCREEVKTGYCDKHQRHSCKEKLCNTLILVSREYCSSHEKEHKEKERQLAREELQKQVLIKESELAQLIATAKDKRKLVVNESFSPVQSQPQADTSSASVAVPPTNKLAEFFKSRDQNLSLLSSSASSSAPKTLTAQQYLNQRYPGRWERESITRLNLNSQDLSATLNLSGFVNLEILAAENNQLTELVLEKNVVLKKIYCQNNHLTQLNLINSTQLTKLWCNNNQLTQLDLSNNAQLIELSCNNNHLTQLNLINSTQLTLLGCTNNQLTQLNLDNNTQLTVLVCYNNQLTQLDLTNNTQLTTLGCNDNQLTQLDVKNNTQLTVLVCYNNQLTQLDLSNNAQLIELACSENQLTQLDLSNNAQLTILYCINNQLTQLNLDNNTQLTKLYCSNNQLTQLDLTNNTQLTTLDCHDNYQLSFVLISGTSWGKLISFQIANTLFAQELASYANNYWAWAEAHSQLWAEKDLAPITNNSYQSPLQSITEIPDALKSNASIGENLSLDSLVSYTSFSLRDARKFSWERRANPFPPQSPRKLFNISTKQIELTKDNPKRYAIISYHWGKITPTPELEQLPGWRKNVTVLGNRALFKASKALEYLNSAITDPTQKISHFWMDQLCVNQKHIEEVNQEVAKMYQYYTQAECTLIPINCELGAYNPNDVTPKFNFALKALQTIVNSIWFSRTWNFQEGWLSQQSIFLFDDCLVDGRLISQLLASQIEELYIDKQIKGLDVDKIVQAPNQYLTPLGSTYSSQTQRQFLGLWNALYLVKERQLTIAVDALYGVLGSVENGKRVLIDYKPNSCSLCPQQIEDKNCAHEGKYKVWATYTDEDLQERLTSTIKTLNPLYLFSSSEVFEQFFVKKNLFFTRGKLILQRNEELVNLESLEQYQLPTKLLTNLTNSINWPEQTFSPFSFSSWVYSVKGQGKKCVLTMNNHSLAMEVLEGCPLAESDIVFLPTQTEQAFTNKVGVKGASLLAFRTNPENNVFHFLRLFVYPHSYIYSQKLRGKLSSVTVDISQQSIISQPVNLPINNNTTTLQSFLWVKHGTKPNGFTELGISEEHLSLRGGELDLSKFPFLQSLELNSYVVADSITHFAIDNPLLVAFNYSGTGYPVTFSVINWQSLELLTITHSQLAQLDVSSVSLLRELDLSHNRLERIVFSPRQKRLAHINLINNEPLKTLASFTNLTLKQLIELKLDPPLVNQLKPYLQSHEELVTISVQQLQPQQVNNVTLLARWQTRQNTPLITLTSPEGEAITNLEEERLLIEQSSLPLELPRGRGPSARFLSALQGTATFFRSASQSLKKIARSLSKKRRNFTQE